MSLLRFVIVLKVGRSVILEEYLLKSLIEFLLAQGIMSDQEPEPRTSSKKIRVSRRSSSESNTAQISTSAGLNPGLANFPPYHMAMHPQYAPMYPMQMLPSSGIQGGLGMYPTDTVYQPLS